MRSIAIGASDLNGGLRVRVVKDGDKVAGQVTLDNCAYHFRSEADRVARHQTSLLTPSRKQTGYGQEVVAYDTEAHAGAALQELRRSVRTCHLHVFASSGAKGAPRVSYDSVRLLHGTHLPVSDSVVETTVFHVKGVTQTIYGIYAFQREGTVLDGIYLNLPRPPGQADLAVFDQLATLAGTKEEQQAGTNL